MFDTIKRICGFGSPEAATNVADVTTGSDEVTRTGPEGATKSHEVDLYAGDKKGAAAEKLPQIIAAATSWRNKLEKASSVHVPLCDNPVVREKLTDGELDAFEAALITDFARAKAHCPQSDLFMDHGLEVWLHLSCAADTAGVQEKIRTFGFLSRMRILDDTVDHEIERYRSGKWQNVWRKPD
jgi:hypothetical protein